MGLSVLCIFILSGITINIFFPFPFIQLFHLYREDDFFGENKDQNIQIEKLKEAYVENDKIDQELKEDIQILKESTASPNEVTLADYNSRINEIHIYESSGGSIVNLSHEFIHVMGKIPGYEGISEGITELLNREFFYKEESKYYWNAVTVVRILCEILDPAIILQSYFTKNKDILVQELIAVVKNEVLAHNLLSMLEECSKNTYNLYDLLLRKLTIMHFKHI